MLRKLILYLHFKNSLKPDNIYRMCLIEARRRYLPSINAMACSKADI